MPTIGPDTGGSLWWTSSDVHELAQKLAGQKKAVQLAIEGCVLSEAERARISGEWEYLSTAIAHFTDNPPATVWLAMPDGLAILKRMNVFCAELRKDNCANVPADLVPPPMPHNWFIDLAGSVENLLATGMKLAPLILLALIAIESEKKR